VNHGQKILLRLRPHHSPDRFYEEEEIIGTMLHEASTISAYQRRFWNSLFSSHITYMGLMMKNSIKYVCHNSCSRHADVAKYLGELENEYYALRSKGYSGEGFHSDGKRLGQGVSHNVPLSQAKSKAVLAAEQRKRTADIMGNSGGRKLGGTTRIQAKSPRELAAEVRASLVYRLSDLIYIGCRTKS
jgi:hypothetical protein